MGCGSLAPLDGRAPLHASIPIRHGVRLASRLALDLAAGAEERFSRRQRGPKLAAFAALARVVAGAASTYVKSMTRAASP
jgi:hypothetical protein